MRSHVFPVCEAYFKNFEIKNFEEGDESLLRDFGDGVLATTPGGYSSFCILRLDNSGEYLIEDQGSGPDGWPPKYDETIPINLLLKNTYQNQDLFGIGTAEKIGADKNLRAGYVFCIGVKPQTGDFSNRISSYKYTYINNEIWKAPFSDTLYDGSFGPIPENENNQLDYPFFITMMFTGTRFVLLGSNNWIS
jgi:hypothetical protein